MQHAITQNKQQSRLTERLASQYGIDPKLLYETLAKSVFGSKDDVPTKEEMMTLLVICEKTGLNPFAKQITAFRHHGAIVPIITIDGWISIIHNQKNFDGLSITYSDKTVNVQGTELPEWCECSIRLKGIDRPISIPEYAEECFNPQSFAWHKYPRRMLRHKAIIQCARIAFSISGVGDPDDEDWSAHEQVAFNAKLRKQQRPEASPVTEAFVECSDARFQSIMQSLVSAAQKRNSWDYAAKWIQNHFVGERYQQAMASLHKARTMQIEGHDEEIDASMIEANATIDDVSLSMEEVPPPPPEETLSAESFENLY